MFKLQRHRDIFIKRTFFTVAIPPLWYQKFNSNNPPTDDVIGELVSRFTTDDLMILQQHGFGDLHALFNDAAIDPWVVHRIVKSNRTDPQIKLLVRQIVTVTNQSLITPEVVEYVRGCVGINDSTSYVYCNGSDYSVDDIGKWIIAMQQLNRHCPVLFGRHYVDDKHKFRLDDPLYVACEVARELVVKHVNGTEINISEINTDLYNDYKQIVDDFLAAVSSRFDNLMGYDGSSIGRLKKATA